MKVETRTEVSPSAWEGLSRFLPQGVTLFASGLSGFLLILIGLPVAMVILMSLRTGFPGEQVPFTLENFATVYLAPRTYEILINTVFFAISSVSITLLIAVPLGWADPQWFTTPRLLILTGSMGAILGCQNLSNRHCIDELTKRLDRRDRT